MRVSHQREVRCPLSQGFPTDTWHLSVTLVPPGSVLLGATTARHPNWGPTLCLRAQQPGPVQEAVPPASTGVDRAGSRAGSRNSRGQARPHTSPPSQPRANGLALAWSRQGKG